MTCGPHAGTFRFSFPSISKGLAFGIFTEWSNPILNVLVKVLRMPMELSFDNPALRFLGCSLFKTNSLVHSVFQVYPQVLELNR